MTLHRYAAIVSVLLVVVIGIGASVTTLAEFAATQPDLIALARGGGDWLQRVGLGGDRDFEGVL